MFYMKKVPDHFYEPRWFIKYHSKIGEAQGRRLSTTRYQYGVWTFLSKYYDPILFLWGSNVFLCGTYMYLPLSLSLGRMVVRVWFPESTTSHIFDKEARYDLNVHVDLVTDSQSYLKAKSRHHKVLVGSCNQLYSIINF